jgi:hypothetical protein
MTKRLNFNFLIIGAGAILLAFFGLSYIKTENLFSYSELFYVHRAVFGVLLFVFGGYCLAVGQEIGIGLMGLAVFNSGFLHNNIISPLIIVLMLITYLRRRHYFYFVPQILFAIIQGLLYTVFYGQTLFGFGIEVAEMLGILTSGIYYINMAFTPRP